MEHEQQCPQVLPLVIVKRGEQGVLGLLRSVRGQLHAAGRQIPLELDATVRENDGELQIEAVTHADQRELA